VPPRPQVRLPLGGARRKGMGQSTKRRRGCALGGTYSRGVYTDIVT